MKYVLQLIIDIIIIVLMFACMIQDAVGENFTNANPKVVEAAEQARLNSAQFWANQQLRPWYKPCTISTEISDSDGGGHIKYTIGEGNVYDWSMKVVGRESSWFSDTIPHEVDHTVRVSIIRRQPEIWVDEGCASLFESERMHSKLRKIAQQAPASIITVNFLNSKTPPQNTETWLQWYAVGFTLVEMLLEKKGPETLLELQSMTVPMEDRLMMLYGLNVAALRSEWDTRRRSPQTCEETHCVYHFPIMGKMFGHENKPTLIVWGANYCPDCVRFKKDYFSRVKEELYFGAALRKKYHVRFVDTVIHKRATIRNKITTIPAFQIVGYKPVFGYSTKDKFLAQFNAVDPQKYERKPVEIVAPIPPVIEAPIIEDNAADPEPVIEVPEEKEEEEEEEAAEVIAPPPPIVDAKQNETEIPVIVRPAETLTDSTLIVQDDSPQTQKAASSGIWTTLVTTAANVAMSSAGVGAILGTGGTAGAALAVFQFAKWRRKRRQPQLIESEATQVRKAPFPRRLDEAGQLRQLRKSEGRVAALDALTGMLFDDEWQRQYDESNAAEREVLTKLRRTIDARVNEIAPISV